MDKLDKFDWTETTYRLDEVVNRFNVPCVVKVTEGIYSASELETMSSGDIIKIDYQRKLHKVAANFLSDFHRQLSTSPPNSAEYVDLVAEEILIPLSYTGKLKVLKEIKKYESVRELSKECPRYARVLCQLSYQGPSAVKTVLEAGTLIEVDRVIQGSAKANREEMLVVSYTNSDKKIDTAIPFSTKGSFMLVQDVNKYTLQEVVDRYTLPQVVEFEDDKLKQVYTRDLEEGLSRSVKVSGTVRLNRLVTQQVIVGHYKPLEEVEEQQQDTRKRTMIVLPLDSEIGSITVVVAQNSDEAVYDDILKMFRTPDDNFDDGALYVDFAMDTGIRRICHDTYERPDQNPSQSHYQNNSAATSNPPPPKPHGKIHFKPRVPTPPLGTEEYEPIDISTGRPNNGVKPIAVTSPYFDDGYLTPSPKLSSAPQPTICLSDIDFTKQTKLVEKERKEHAKAGGKKQDKKQKVKKSSSSVADKFKFAFNRPKIPLPETPTSQNEMFYDSLMDDTTTAASTVQNPSGNSWLHHHTENYPKIATDQQTYHMTALKQALAARQPEVKDFAELTCTEIYDRLVLCSMKEVADICRDEKLDGAYFNDITDEVLSKEPFNLNSFKLDKFRKIQNNWVPKK